MAGGRLFKTTLFCLGIVGLMVPRLLNAQGANAAQQYYQAGGQLYAKGQYAQAAKYYQAAIQLNPNYAEAYQGIGSCWYAMGNKQYALAYFQKALQLNPNNSQLSQFVQSMGGQAPAGGGYNQQGGGNSAMVNQNQGGSAVMQGTAASSSKPGFGIRLLAGMHYVLSDPSQIVQAATAVNAGTSGVLVGLSGVTPNYSMAAGMELFYQISPNFELNLGGAFLPLSSLDYTATYTNFPYSNSANPPPTSPTFKYDYGASIMTISLGGKVLFGDPKTVKFSVGAGVDISPVGLNFTKTQYESNGLASTSSDADWLDYNSTGSYSTMAFGAHLVTGMDFVLGNNLSLGLYLGYRLLNASSFQGSGDTLAVDNTTSDVGPASQLLKSGISNTSALSLDFSGAIEGVNLSIGF